MLIWFFCLLLCAVLCLSNLQITLAPCLLLISCTIEYLVLHEMFCMQERPIIFHLIISLFYLLYHNNYNKLNKSKNHPSTLFYYLLSVKWNFVFIPWEIHWVVQPKPDQPDRLLQPCSHSYYKVTYFQRYKILNIVQNLR